MFIFIFKGPVPLKFDPADAFFENTVRVTCGPPPENLNFGADWTAEWRRNLELIQPDENHRFSIEDGAATLTVIRFTDTDNGRKWTECGVANCDIPKSYTTIHVLHRNFLSELCNVKYGLRTISSLQSQTSIVTASII